MKQWVFCIFCLMSKLGTLCARIEEQVDEASRNLTTDTLTLFNNVLRLNDAKRRIVNFLVLGRMMKSRLEKEEAVILQRRAKMESFDEIAKSLGLSRSGAARKCDAAVQKCIDAALSLTFTEERFIAEYKDIPLIYDTVRRLSKAAGIKAA
ncbi:MAG: hypothetical protein FWH03_01270 [Firmicutes bacterium]|nr:hypothetical protein [Bacillota bacterium]